MTGYELSKVVNEMLVSRNLKRIPPQMIYNYMSKGYIKTFEENGQKLVSEEEAELWCEGYVNKKMSKVSK